MRAATSSCWRSGILESAFSTSALHAPSARLVASEGTSHCSVWPDARHTSSCRRRGSVPRGSSWALTWLGVGVEVEVGTSFRFGVRVRLGCLGLKAGLGLGVELGAHHWRAADGWHVARRRGGGGQRVLREQVQAWAGAHLDLGAASALAHRDHARRRRVELEVEHRTGRGRLPARRVGGEVARRVGGEVALLLAPLGSKRVFAGGGWWGGWVGAGEVVGGAGAAPGGGAG